MAQASHSVDIDLPAREFYRLITGFEDYPSFLSDVREAKILTRGRQQWVAAFRVQVIRDIDYTLELSGKPGHSLTWTLVESSLMTSNDGSWSLEDLDGGRCRATYSVDLKLARLVPRTITNLLVQSRLPAMLAEWAAHARTVAGAKRSGRRR